MTLNRREALWRLASSTAAVAWPITARPQTGGIEDLTTHLQDALASGFAPGFVGLAARGDRVRAITLGRMALTGPPMRRDSIFRIASMTKPITAAAAMLLIADGKLTLDEPIERLLPELANRRVLRSLDGPVDATVPAQRPISVEDLLTFRLGWGLLLEPPGTYPVQRLIADLQIVGFGPPDPTTPFGNDEWLRRLATVPLFAQPGQRWLYTTGSNILGVLIARASRQSFGEFLTERLFAPLGMRHTGFHVPPETMNRFVTAYRPKDGGLDVVDDPTTGGWSRPPRFEAGDAGLVSTADDYFAFVRMLLGGGVHQGRRILPSKAVEAMTVDHLTAAQRRDGEAILQPGRGWGYGMSVVVDEASSRAPAGSIGWSGGFGTRWQSDPATGITTILLTQRLFDGPKPDQIFERFEQDARRTL